MSNDGNSNSVAIVALILIGLLIAGGAFLYYNGGIGNTSSTTIIEAPEMPDLTPEE